MYLIMKSRSKINYWNLNLHPSSLENIDIVYHVYMKVKVEVGYLMNGRNLCKKWKIPNQHIYVLCKWWIVSWTSSKMKTLHCWTLKFIINVKFHLVLFLYSCMLLLISTTVMVKIESYYPNNVIWMMDIHVKFVDRY